PQVGRVGLPQQLLASRSVLRARFDGSLRRARAVVAPRGAFFQIRHAAGHGGGTGQSGARGLFYRRTGIGGARAGQGCHAPVGRETPFAAAALSGTLSLRISPPRKSGGTG